MKAPKLLSISADSKTVKGEKRGYLTAIHYGAPADVAGVGNQCPHATDGCRMACLFTKGRAEVFKAIIPSRIARTQFLVTQPAAAMLQLDRELSAFKLRAKKYGFTPVARLNGTTDKRWELTGVMARHADLRFYDYTKFPPAGRQFLPRNYTLTYSFTGEAESLERSNAWRRRGVNTAVVFRVKRGRPLPKRFLGRPVIDGDLSDLRFLDKKGVFVGLRLKGRDKTETPFVVEVDDRGRAIDYRWQDVAPMPAVALTFNAKGVRL